MTPLAADYLSTLAAQIGSVSAFLGGFAATFLAMFLTMGHRSRAASVAIGASAIASVAFVVAVIGSTALIAMLHPHAPAGMAADVGKAQVLGSLAFLLGIAALLASLGASGWTRSRRAGWMTSVTAGIGALLACILLVS